MNETFGSLVGLVVMIFTIGMILNFGWRFANWFTSTIDKIKTKTGNLALVLLGLIMIYVAYKMCQ